MKLSKLFHWLYFSVMVMPLLAIPIFAIYSHRHTIDNYSVVRTEPLEVNAIQGVLNGKPNAFVGDPDNWLDDTSDGLTYVDGTIQSYLYTGFEIYSYIDLNIEENDICYFSFNFYTDSPIQLDISLYDNAYSCVINEDTISTNLFFKNFVFDLSQTSNNSFIAFSNYEEYPSGNKIQLSNVQLFNLTSIFGSGNEPTADVFKSYLKQDYYDYGNNVLTIGTHNVTYNDTDIGSQFTYDIYNVIDKYFNYDKVVNFGDLYSWLNNTFFSGQAPLGFFIFWHLLEYWLLTSLLWLLFDVLMYVPMLVHRWLDKASLS